MGWPNYFPTHCPPANAKPFSGIVYRWVSPDTIKENDFIPEILLSPDRDFFNRCIAAGLSFCRSQEGLNQLKSRYKRKFGGKRQAYCKINESFGVGFEDPAINEKIKDHITFWHKDNINFSEIFSYCNLEE